MDKQPVRRHFQMPHIATLVTWILFLCTVQVQVPGTCTLYGVLVQVHVLLVLRYQQRGYKWAVLYRCSEGGRKLESWKVARQARGS